MADIRKFPKRPKRRKRSPPRAIHGRSTDDTLQALILSDPGYRLSPANVRAMFSAFEELVEMEVAARVRRAHLRLLLRRFLEG